MGCNARPKTVPVSRHQCRARVRRSPAQMTWIRLRSSADVAHRRVGDREHFANGLEEASVAAKRRSSRLARALRTVAAQALLVVPTRARGAPGPRRCPRRRRVAHDPKNLAATSAGPGCSLRTIESDVGRHIRRPTVRVRAVGLNFADVFTALGLYAAAPEGAFTPGCGARSWRVVTRLGTRRRRFPTGRRSVHVETFRRVRRRSDVSDDADACVTCASGRSNKALGFGAGIDELLPIGTNPGGSAAREIDGARALGGGWTS